MRILSTGPADYANVVAGLLELHASTKVAEWFDLAQRLRDRADALFLDAKSGRYLAASEPLVPGLWARVPVPSPGPGEPPSPEATTLISIVGHPGANEAQRASADMLARAIAAEVPDGPPAARGDLLLALQGHAREVVGHH